MVAGRCPILEKNFEFLTWQIRPSSKTEHKGQTWYIMWPGPRFFQQAKKAIYVDETEWGWGWGEGEGDWWGWLAAVIISVYQSLLDCFTPQGRPTVCSVHLCSLKSSNQPRRRGNFLIFVSWIIMSPAPLPPAARVSATWLKYKLVSLCHHGPNHPRPARWKKLIPSCPDITSHHITGQIVVKSF